MINDKRMEKMPKKISKKQTEQIIGKSGFSKGQYCCIFPYMSPDNNSELATNIALMHSVLYRMAIKDNYYGIKHHSHCSNEVRRMVRQYDNKKEKILPVIEDFDVSNKNKLMLKSRFERIIDSVIGVFQKRDK